MAATLRVRELMSSARVAAAPRRSTVAVVARATRTRKSTLQRIEEAASGVRGAAEALPEAAPVSSRYSTPTRVRRGGMASRFGADETPAPTASYSAPAAAPARSSSRRAGGAAARFGGSDSSDSSSYSAPSRSAEPAFSTPTRARRGGMAARFGGSDDTPAPAASSSATTSPTRARRGGAAARFGGADSSPAPVASSRPSSATPTRARRGGVASKFGN